MRTLLIACLGLLLAPLAQAQFIDCGLAGDECNETLYGLGNDPPEGPHTNTTTINHIGPGDGSCGPEELFRFQGRIRIREQDSCAVSATTRCPVEIPLVANDSGFFNINQSSIPLGPLGIANLSAGLFTDMGGNQGNRQLSGTCGISGDECALDSECDAQNPGDVCTSTCFSDPGTSCSSHADCAANDCRTEIEWDGIGLCSDQATVCSSDADCPGEFICRAGLEWVTSQSSCICCQSTLGTLCPAFFALPEYPALNCGGLGGPENHVAAPDWLFEGGQGTPFDLETIQVPGQQEGICNGNRSRPCGVLGDFWAGAANGKCESGTPACAADPFGDDLAIASTCDDVAFGGVAGDFCDLSEQSVRSQGGNPDGTPDPTICSNSAIRLVGTPGELCGLPIDIPEGDPQPGCRLINIGVSAQPDLDCNGIDDTTEGRCTPEGGAICSNPADCPPCANDGDCASGNCINNGDLCPFIGEVNWFLDSNNDDIGDECQCGDGTGDGAISSPDIAAVALCANGAGAPGACDATIIDATGDNATTAEDIGGVVAAVNGAITTSALECVRNLDTTVP